MAIWQLIFNLVSAKFPYNNCINIKNDSLELLCKTLPYKKSWTNEIDLYGEIDGTCLEVFYVNYAVDDITVKLDIRNLQKNHIMAIYEFAKINNLKILFEEVVYDFNANKIIDIIEGSTTKSFLHNPREFLNKISCPKDL